MADWMPQFRGARAQFESLGGDGHAELERIVLAAQVEMSRLGVDDDPSTWIESATKAMQAIVTTLNLPPAEFSANHRQKWPILICSTPTEDHGRFDVDFYPRAIANCVPLEKRIREMLRQIWGIPLEYLIHHHDGLIQHFKLYQVLSRSSGPTSPIRAFVREAAQACGIEELVMP